MFKVIALMSGGKDSCYSAMKCKSYGHEIVVVANLYPTPKNDSKDSYMYQTQGWELLPAIAECMGLPLERREITGQSVNQDLRYERQVESDEVEDLYALLSDIKKKYPQVNAVCSGAVLSTYQRNRIENVCARLDLVPLSFLWNRKQNELFQEIINSQVEAVLVKVCSMGLDQTHVGKTIASSQNYFMKLEKDFGFHVCGEGGEYETITLDCPLFIKGKIVLDETKILTLDPRPFSPICVLDIIKFHIEPRSNKSLPVPLTMQPAVVAQKTTEIPSVLSSDRKLLTSKCKRGNHNSDLVLGPFIGSDFVTVMKEFERNLKPGQLELVCLVHLYLRDLSDFQQVNEEFAKVFKSSKKPPPARVTVELVGFEDSCVLGLTAILSLKERHVLHVTSRSEWAPMCIGPYSQATKSKEIIFLAGQIPLDPATMIIPELGCKDQLKLSLRNALRVAGDSYMKGTCIVGGIIYVSTRRLKDEGKKAIQIFNLCYSEILLEQNPDYQVLTKEFPLIFLAVPRLPRDANVETELIFLTDEKDEDIRVELRVHEFTPTKLNGNQRWARLFVDIYSTSIDIEHDMIVPVQAIAVSNNKQISWHSVLEYSLLWS